MKHYITFTAVLLIYSCRSVQQRSSSILHSNKTAEKNQITATQLFRQQDSSSRHWLFRTDTTFYFHPDSGLYAKGGWLWLQEIHQGENISLQLYDSLTYRAHEDQQISQQTFSERIAKRNYWWIVLAVIIVAVLRRLFA